MCGLFVEVESTSFERRLNDVLPLLLDIIKPDQYSNKVMLFEVHDFNNLYHVWIL